MNLHKSILCLCAAFGIANSPAVAQSNSPLTLVSADGHHAIHVFPHHRIAKELGLIHKKGDALPATPALLYHGGPVMVPTLRFYVIFWQPSTLQSGAATSMSAGYKAVEQKLVSGYEGHSLAAITTQYYQATPGKTYISGTGGLQTTFTDTQPFPTSGCAASLGPNCITDAQLQAEVQRVITNRGWTAGLNAMFVVFTTQGEASCFDNTGAQCSTNYYCAYHSYFGSAANPVIYSDEPFGDPNSCLGSGTEPNASSGGVEADPAATAASHEISEAVTDPELNAWFDSSGSEIGDICAYNYGTNTWDSGLANQFWGGRYFELQTEYNNHTASCLQAGP